MMFRKRGSPRLQVARRSHELPSSSLPSAPRSMALPDSRSPVTSYNLEPPPTAWPPFDPLAPMASSRPRRRDFLKLAAAEEQLARYLYLALQNDIRRTSFQPEKNTADRHQPFPHKTSPQCNAHHVPQSSQARRRLREPLKSNILFYPDFVSMTLRQEGAAGGLFFQKKLLPYETDRIGVLKLVFTEFISSVE